jgi:hypothetical protein
MCTTTTGHTAAKAAAALHATIGNKLAALSEPFLAEPFSYNLMDITPEQLTLDEARAAATLLRCLNFWAINLTHEGVPETERAQYVN